MNTKRNHPASPNRKSEIGKRHDEGEPKNNEFGEGEGFIERKTNLLG